MQSFSAMNNKKLIIKCLAVTAILVICAACHKTKIDAPVVGHWGCEQYVSCRTIDSVGNVRWDTLSYDLGYGKGIEVFFNEDGSGKLCLNESPAFIKKFDCNYSYDEANRQVVIEAPGLLYFLYHAAFSLEENRAAFDVEEINDTEMVASWTNSVSEDTPFFERFFLKRID